MPDEKSPPSLPSLQDLIEGNVDWPKPKPTPSDPFQRALVPTGQGRVLKWGSAPLGGPGGMRIGHNIGHTRYFPQVAVVGRPTAEVGDITFDIQPTWVTIFNSGPGIGRMVVVLIDLSDAPTF